MWGATIEFLSEGGATMNTDYLTIILIYKNVLIVIIIISIIDNYALLFLKPSEIFMYYY